MTIEQAASGEGVIGGWGGEQLSFVSLKIQANFIRINNICILFVCLWQRP